MHRNIEMTQMDIQIMLFGNQYVSIKVCLSDTITRLKTARNVSKSLKKVNVTLAHISQSAVIRITFHFPKLMTLIFIDP